MDPLPKVPYYCNESLIRQGQRPALIEDAMSLDYAHLAAMIAAFKVQLQAIPTARILVVSASQSSMIAALLALAQTSHIAIPTAPQNKIDDLDTIARCTWVTHRWVVNSGLAIADGLTTAKASAEPIHPLLQKIIPESRSGLILFTSGSSGRSKAILHDFERLLIGLQPTKTNVSRKILLLMYPDHIGGLDIVCKALASGSTLYIPPNREATTIGQWIATHGIEVLPATPTFLRIALLQGIFEQYDCRSLQIISYGAEPMPPKLLQALQKTLPQVEFRATFGTTETGTVSLRSGNLTNGLIYPNENRQQLRIEAGELWVKSPASFIGYLDRHCRGYDKEGWIATGDRAEWSTNGGLRIFGRNRNMISVGGEKVDPVEVENALLQIDGVISARIHAEAHALMGHALTATIMTSSECTDISPGEWKRLIRRKLSPALAGWKIPSRIKIETLPPEINPRLKERQG
jgi:acyl-CoA synthetase (AMP-forming)/AMP-acid ligase II